jgi:hypothetical protein
MLTKLPDILPEATAVDPPEGEPHPAPTRAPGTVSF